jgi:hypothetical protein
MTAEDLGVSEGGRVDLGAAFDTEGLGALAILANRSVVA